MEEDIDWRALFRSKAELLNLGKGLQVQSYPHRIRFNWKLTLPYREGILLIADQVYYVDPNGSITPLLSLERGQRVAGTYGDDKIWIYTNEYNNYRTHLYDPVTDTAILVSTLDFIAIDRDKAVVRDNRDDTWRFYRYDDTTKSFDFIAKVSQSPRRYYEPVVILTGSHYLISGSDYEGVEIYNDEGQSIGEIDNASIYSATDRYLVYGLNSEKETSTRLYNLVTRGDFITNDIVPSRSKVDMMMMTWSVPRVNNVGLLVGLSPGRMKKLNLIDFRHRSKVGISVFKVDNDQIKGVDEYTRPYFNPQGTVLFILMASYIHIITNG